MRDRARQQWLETRVHPVQVVAAGTLLDPYALTIGFARRFATYKRANLILRDLDRLLDLINRPNQPVQIIFAGKAHPADEPGKLLIQEVLLAFTIVFVLAIIWALFTPRWVEKLANRYAGTVVFGSILLVFGGMAAFLIYEWIKAFG